MHYKFCSAEGTAAFCRGRESSVKPDESQKPRRGDRRVSFAPSDSTVKHFECRVDIAKSLSARVTYGRSHLPGATIGA